ncbi:Xaa-Pro dipeptidase [Alkalibacillus filiformis]|uniref:Xaa-Pro dipeptidase n=1 Tax=Alkalibacillus filiformis TaxID=200990 RepID=A0ABU0DS54_9BACI|nr:Xaa-Pro peptidase family protein [Alkalibacillus filiformis]MDQ0351252.1 Xaa-Pro dipeptidase [Alkalibacillus filiformis]
MEKRINQLIESLQNNNLESIFITSKANVFYFSNLYAEAHERLIALYIDVQGRKTIIAPALELEDIKNAGWTSEIITYFDHENPWAKFEKWLSHSGGLPSNLAIEEENLNVERFQQLQTLTKNGDIQYGQRLLNELRVIKDDDEVKILQEAARFADYGIETAVKHIKPGKTELEIIAEVEYALKEKGIRHMSFSTLVLSGAKTAAPHGTPSMKPIEDGDFVLMDLGVVFKGYCSDITRTVAVGEVNEEQEKVYNTVLAAQQKALNVCEVGTPLGQIDRAARSVIEDAGYGEYFTHRIGHGIGIDVHEFPSMASNNEDPLKPGMAFTIEPGIYVSGVGGVRIEDDVLMTENGPKTLTQFPKSLQKV